MRIGSRVPKHFIEDRLPKFIESVNRALPEVPEFVGLIEDRGDALLLIEARERNFNITEHFASDNALS